MLIADPNVGMMVSSEGGGPVSTLKDIMVVGYDTSPFMSLYGVEGFDILENPPSALTTGMRGATFNLSCSLLAEGYQESPYLAIYNTSDWSRVPTPTAAPTGIVMGNAFNPAGTILAAGHWASPFLTLYNTADWSKIANPTILPTGNGYGVAFNPAGTILAAAHTTSPFLTLYNTADWSKLPNPSVLPTGNGYGVAFNPTGTILAVTHTNFPFLTLYNTADWSKIANPTVLPPLASYSVAFGKGAVSEAAWDVSTAVYSGKSVSVAAVENWPDGLFFKPDGLVAFTLGFMNDTVYQYTLSTAWDISTMVYAGKSKSVAAQDTSPRDIFFKPDGTLVYVVGADNDTVYQYTLSTAWDISTMVYAGKSKSVAAQDTAPQGMSINVAGTVLILVGALNKTIYQYTLSTAWDISTAVYANKSKSVAAQDSDITGVFLKPDGTIMFVSGQASDTVYQYTLSTAWDISTAVYASKSKSVADKEGNMFFVSFNQTGSSMYIGGVSNYIYQYNLE